MAKIQRRKRSILHVQRRRVMTSQELAQVWDGVMQIGGAYRILRATKGEGTDILPPSEILNFRFSWNVFGGHSAPPISRLRHNGTACVFCF